MAGTRAAREALEREIYWLTDRDGGGSPRGGTEPVMASLREIRSRLRRDLQHPVPQGLPGGWWRRIVKVVLFWLLRPARRRQDAIALQLAEATELLAERVRRLDEDLRRLEEESRVRPAADRDRPEAAER